jgi:hypothetical protein
MAFAYSQQMPTIYMLRETFQHKLQLPQLSSLFVNVELAITSCRRFLELLLPRYVSRADVSRKIKRR